MLVLDTDHLSHFDEATAAGGRLRERLLSSNEEPVATIISAEEQLRGWLAQLHQTHSDPHRAIPIYARLQPSGILRELDCSSVGNCLRRFVSKIARRKCQDWINGP